MNCSKVVGAGYTCSSGACVPPADSDGVYDSSDACPGYDDHVDTDSDGTADGCDSDDDGDGYSDADETASGTDPMDASSVPASYPDLIITGINSVYVNSTNNMTLNFTVKNQGIGYADANYLYNRVELNYLKLDGSSVTSTGTERQTLHLSSPWRGTYTLPPGDSITVKIVTYVDSGIISDIRSGNSHDIDMIFTTDYTSSITESDETNNQYSTTVTLTSANLVS